MCCLQDTAPEAAVAAEEEIAAGNLAEQTPEDAAAAGEHLAEHIQVRRKYTRLVLQVPELCLSPIRHLQSHQRVMVRAAHQEYMASVLAISIEPVGAHRRAESESVCLCACVSGVLGLCMSIMLARRMAGLIRLFARQPSACAACSWS